MEASWLVKLQRGLTAGGPGGPLGDAVSLIGQPPCSPVGQWRRRPQKTSAAPLLSASPLGPAHGPAVQGHLDPQPAPASGLVETYGVDPRMGAHPVLGALDQALVPPWPDPGVDGVAWLLGGRRKGPARSLHPRSRCSPPGSWPTTGLALWASYHLPLCPSRPWILGPGGGVWRPLPGRRVQPSQRLLPLSTLWVTLCWQVSWPRHPHPTSQGDVSRAPQSGAKEGMCLGRGPEWEGPDIRSWFL